MSARRSYTLGPKPCRRANVTADCDQARSAMRLTYPWRRQSSGTSPMTEITLRVNGQNQKIAVDDPDIPLLYVLRDDLSCADRSSAAASANAAPARSSLTARRCAPASPSPSMLGQGNHDARGPRRSRTAPAGAGGVHRRSSGAMRLLHQRHDHGRHRAAVSAIRIRRTGRPDGARRQSLPLRQPCPGDRRRAARRAGGLSHDRAHRRSLFQPAPPRSLSPSPCRAGRARRPARSQPTASTPISASPRTAPSLFSPARSISARARAPQSGKSSPRSSAFRPRRIALIEGDTGLTPDQGGDRRQHRDHGRRRQIRQAAATARARLLSLAAAASACQRLDTSDGSVVRHGGREAVELCGAHRRPAFDLPSTRPRHSATLTPTRSSEPPIRVPISRRN